MSDYKQRMIREHRELQERISKLAHMLEGYAAGLRRMRPTSERIPIPTCQSPTRCGPRPAQQMA